MMAGLQGTIPVCQQLRQRDTKGLKTGLVFAISYTLETPLISMGSHMQHEAALSRFSPTICKLYFYHHYLTNMLKVCISVYLLPAQ